MCDDEHILFVFVTVVVVDTATSNTTTRADASGATMACDAVGTTDRIVASIGDGELALEVDSGECQ